MCGEGGLYTLNGSIPKGPRKATDRPRRSDPAPHWIEPARLWTECLVPLQEWSSTRRDLRMEGRTTSPSSPNAATP